MECNVAMDSFKNTCKNLQAKIKPIHFSSLNKSDLQNIVIIHTKNCYKTYTRKQKNELKHWINTTIKNNKNKKQRKKQRKELEKKKPHEKWTRIAKKSSKPWLTKWEKKRHYKLQIGNTWTQ